jgi:hypothetical protein
VRLVIHEAELSIRFDVIVDVDVRKKPPLALIRDM